MSMKTYVKYYQNTCMKVNSAFGEYDGHRGDLFLAISCSCLAGLKGAIGLGLSRRQSADIVNDFTNGSQVILRLLASEDGGVCWQI